MSTRRQASLTAVIDTHLHLFDPQRHPFSPGASYRPQSNECASWPALRDLMRAHGVETGVLVAPTAGYGFDLQPMTTTLSEAGSLLRGVARLRGDESSGRLDELATQGVVGVRLDLRSDGIGVVAALESGGAVAAWAARRWFVQIQADARDWVDVAGQLAQWPVVLLIDHCGLPDVSAGLDQPGFAAVCRLAISGRVFVKLSGAFRFSGLPWPHADTDPYAQRLIDCFGPERCVWGSDWPFVRMSQRLDYGSVLGLLQRWIPDRAAREQILCRSALALLGRSDPQHASLNSGGAA